MRNTLNWFEIPVTDMDRAKKFYETVFDIKMTDLDLGPELKMSLFPDPHGGVGGALCLHSDFYHPGYQGPLVYLNANPTMADKLERVVAAGGKVIKPMSKISDDYGSMSVFEDTEGNRMAMHTNE